MRKPRAKTAVKVVAGTDMNEARAENETAARSPADEQEAKVQAQGALPTAGEAEESQDATAPEAAAIAVVENADIEPVDSEGWGDADLSFLKPAIGPAPTLPMDKLPLAFSELVSGFVEARKLVPDYVAFALLSAMSGAIGNRVRVGLPDGTTETLNTYTVLVGEASTGKGRALNVVEGPLRALDDELSGSADNVAAAVGQAALNAVLEQIQTKVSGRLAIDYEKPLANVTDSASTSLLVAAGATCRLAAGVAGGGA